MRRQSLFRRADRRAGAAEVADLVALAERAHAAFPWKVAVGWDIAITDTVPVLVEGNGSPCVDIIQRVECAPMGTQRFGELLAWHVVRAIEARDQAEQVAGRPAEA
jgi:hypothetical protein